GAAQHRLMRVASATAMAAIAAVVANLLLRAAAVAVFDIPQPEFEPLQARAVVLSTLGGVASAGVVYAAILRLAGDPARVFLVVAAVALVLSLWAPLSLGLADPPENPGTDAESVGTLIAMHVLAAAISVPVLLRISPR
ncbi:MAG TPA: DUF6069 family protein, partial [Solirubrobacteraceae bacterium]